MRLVQDDVLRGGKHDVGVASGLGLDVKIIHGEKTPVLAKFMGQQGAFPTCRAPVRTVTRASRASAFNCAAIQRGRYFDELLFMP